MQQAEPHHESWRSGEKNALLIRRPAASSWPLSQPEFGSTLRKGLNDTKRFFMEPRGISDKRNDDKARVEW